MEFFYFCYEVFMKYYEITWNIMKFFEISSISWSLYLLFPQRFTCTYSTSIVLGDSQFKWLNFARFLFLTLTITTDLSPFYKLPLKFPPNGFEKQKGIKCFLWSVIRIRVKLYWIKDNCVITFSFQIWLSKDIFFG